MNVLILYYIDNTNPDSCIIIDLILPSIIATPEINIFFFEKIIELMVNYDIRNEESQFLLQLMTEMIPNLALINNEQLEILFNLIKHMMETEISSHNIFFMIIALIKKRNDAAEIFFELLIHLLSSDLETEIGTELVLNTVYIILIDENTIFYQFYNILAEFIQEIPIDEELKIVLLNMIEIQLHAEKEK
jgi:hypothetical protein